MSTIRELRRARGLTQSQLATALGLSTITIKSWERNLRRPSREHQALLARFFATTPERINLRPRYRPLVCPHCGEQYAGFSAPPKSA